MEKRMYIVVLYRAGRKKYYLSSLNYALSKYENDAVLFPNSNEALAYATRVENYVNDRVSNNYFSFIGKVEPLNAIDDLA